jgi:hypothetical protein
VAVASVIRRSDAGATSTFRRTLDQRSSVSSGLGQEVTMTVPARLDLAIGAVGLGATRLADGPTWITLADPAGHPFCLVR